MKRIALTAIFTLAGSVAFGQLGSTLGPSAEALPEPSTVVLCLLGAGLMVLLPGRKAA